MNGNRNKLKRYYAPGVWEDQAGGLHYSLPDILKSFGLPDTPENRSALTKILREQLAKDLPQIEIIYRETEED